MAYVLVLFENPASSSVVHKSQVHGGVDVGQMRLVQWNREQLRARVIRTGTKKHLTSIRLAADGEEWDPERGRDAPAVLRRRDIQNEQQRRKATYRKASEALVDHRLYQYTVDAHNQQPGAAVVGEGAVGDDAQQRLFDGITTVDNLIRALPIPITKENLRLLLQKLPCLDDARKGNEQIYAETKAQVLAIVQDCAAFLTRTQQFQTKGK